MHKKIDWRKFMILLIATVYFILSPSTAQAAVVETDCGVFAKELGTPVHQWQDSSVSPKAVILAIHGLTLHGKAYDACARHLAQWGAIVVAPDMRGYGSWYENSRKQGKRCPVDYRKSEKDLDKLARKLRDRYPDLPLYVAGESLGGTMSIRLAARHPELFDGLILSGPAVGYTVHFPLTMAGESLKTLVNPFRQVNVSTYIDRYFSEDRSICLEGLRDQLVRKKLSLADILRTRHIVKSCESQISKLSNRMPILVLHGTKDEMVPLKSTRVLATNVRSADCTVKLLESRGHILLETSHINQETVDIMIGWVDHHRGRQSASLAAGANHERKAERS